MEEQTGRPDKILSLKVKENRNCTTPKKRNETILKIHNFDTRQDSAWD